MAKTDAEEERLQTAAEQAAREARAAYDGYAGATGQSNNMFEDGTALAWGAMREIAHKSIAQWHVNMQAGLDLADSLAKAQDPEERLKLQREFVQKQAERLVFQMRELAASSTSFAKTYGDYIHNAVSPKRRD